MRIASYLGFGWLAIALLVASGAGINLTDGWLRWVLYVPFVIVGIHMTIRFRAFNTQPWRRVHARAMIDYARLAEQESEAAKNENREFDIANPCRTLAGLMFGENRVGEFSTLLDKGRKKYYSDLVESYPRVFVEEVSADRHSEVLESARKDIKASKLGPDIVIAKAIELKTNKLEAARYLHALLLGRVR